MKAKQEKRKDGGKERKRRTEGKKEEGKGKD